VSFTVTDAMVNQYGTNVRLLAQQKYSRFRMCVNEEQITGEAAFLEQVAPTGARKVTVRHDDSPIMNTQHLRRRIAPYDYDWGDLVDRLDKVRMLIDPASTYAQNAAFAMERAFDDETIAAAFGVAFAGHAGGTSITWPNGNSESTPSQPAGTQVGVNDWTYGNGSGNSGLTISKVISGRVALLAGEGDEDEEIYCAVTAKQVGNLLATTEFTSSDYAEVKALANRQWNGMRALGVTWLHSERLAVNGSGQTRVIMWRKSGLGIGVARAVETRIAERPDKRFGVYVYADEAIGASRLEEVKVAELVCV
jgi:hypothetical protein